MIARGLIIVFVSIALYSCSEPFEISRQSEIVVVEGQISNLTGRSFIRIYLLDETGNATSIPELDINVITRSGTQISFVSNANSNLYLPEAGFIGLVGEEYKMEATSPEGLFFESTYDMMVKPLDFNLNTKDTIIADVDNLNVVNLREATAAIAEIPSQDEPVYSRMDFKYSYIDYFTWEVVEVQDEGDFVLYECDDDQSCVNDRDIPIGATTRNEWFFIDPSEICKRVADTLNLVENCDETTCCEYFAEWPAQFEIRAESMTSESYSFWKEVERLRNNNGLIFDTFPFPVSSNVSCVNCDQEVVGIFRTISETIKNREVTL